MPPPEYRVAGLSHPLRGNGELGNVAEQGNGKVNQAVCGGLERGKGRGREKAERAVVKDGPGCGH